MLCVPCTPALAQHPAVLWSWPLFLLVDNPKPRGVTWERAQAALKEARRRDEHAAEFVNIHTCFFKYGVSVNPDSPIALLSYALVQQCVLRNFKTVSGCQLRGWSSPYSVG